MRESNFVQEMSRQLNFTTGLVIVVIGAAIWLFYPSSEIGNASSNSDPMVVVDVPPLTEAEKLGEADFNNFCADCHGRNAAGLNGAAPPLVHKIYEPSHHGDGSFFQAVRRGVRAHHWSFGDMLPVEGIEDEQIERIIVYIRALQRNNGIK